MPYLAELRPDIRKPELVQQYEQGSYQIGQETDGEKAEYRRFGSARPHFFDCVTGELQVEGGKAGCITVGQTPQRPDKLNRGQTAEGQRDQQNYRGTETTFCGGCAHQSKVSPSDASLTNNNQSLFKRRPFFLGCR
jgi:hypothetical protein